MKKQDLIHSFVLLAILIVAVSGLFFFSKLTGYSVISEYTDQASCEGASYTWEVLTENQCTPIEGCVLCAEECVATCQTCEGGTCSDLDYTDQTSCETAGNIWTPQCTDIPGCVLCTEGCLATCQTCEDVVTGGQCVGDVCDSTHLSLCLDESTCTVATGFWYSDVCNVEAQPVATCGDGSCNGDETCSSCDDCACASGYSCNSGVCEDETTGDDEENNSSEEESDVQVSVNAAADSQVTVCTPNWQCDEWGACENAQKIRACVDSNVCGVSDGIPVTSEACGPTESCTDGIQNQDEEGVDCGGSCETACRRSFFSIVGSAVSGPLETGKTFFQKEIMGNKTRTFIVLGVVVFVIAGFVLAKKFLAVKVSLKKGGKF